MLRRLAQQRMTFSDLKMAVSRITRYMCGSWASCL